MQQSKKRKYTYCTSTMTLTDGKRMSICLPDHMNPTDYEILNRYIALQKEAMEWEQEDEQPATAEDAAAHP